LPFASPLVDAGRARNERMRLIRSLPAWVVVAVTIGFAGVAFAYWASTGSGSAGATAGSTTSVTLSPAAPASQLFPGGTSDVALTMTNPNLFTVRIGSLSLDTSQGSGGFGVDAGHPGCNLNALSFTTQTTGWTVPAKIGGGPDGSLPVDLAGALSMSGTAASACQGAGFTVYLVAGP
jgi:hypothetical protein